MDPDTKTITCLTCINSNYSVSSGACKLTDCTTIGLENCDKCVELQIDTVNGGYKRVVPYC